MIPKLLSQAFAGIKHNILAFDFFHGSRFGQMQAAFEGTRPSYGKGLALLEYSDRDLGTAVRKGEITKEQADFARTNRPKLEGMMKEGLNAGRISDALWKDHVAIWPGVKQANHFIFEKLSRGVITQSALYALERNSRLHPDWTPEKLNRYTAKEVNTYYRNLGSQGLFKSKTFQDMARLVFFAPQWIEGLVRSEARGYGQAAKAPFTGNVGNISAAMGKGLLGYFAVTQMINMLTRGQPTWQNPEPGHKMDAWVPDKLQGSTGLFINPMSVFAENTHDFIKYSERGMEAPDIVAQMIKNKLHPMVAAGRSILLGKDFYGRPLHGWDRWAEGLKQAAPIPLFARGGEYKGQEERQMLSTLGVKAVPAPTNVTNIYALADEFRKKEGIDKKTFGGNEYRDLRNALAQGDMDTARKEKDKLLKTKSTSTVDRYFQNIDRHPFTGSKALEQKFQSTLDRQQREIYDRARQEQEGIYTLYQKL